MGASNDTHAWVYGGKDSNNTLLGELWIVDLVSYQWTLLSNFISAYGFFLFVPSLLYFLRGFLLLFCLGKCRNVRIHITGGVHNSFLDLYQLCQLLPSYFFCGCLIFFIYSCIVIILRLEALEVQSILQDHEVDSLFTITIRLFIFSAEQVSLSLLAYIFILSYYNLLLC